MFRTGTTSYIIPANICPTSSTWPPGWTTCQLVLFETDEYGSESAGHGAVRGG